MCDSLVGADRIPVLLADFRVVASEGVGAPGRADQVGRRGGQGECQPPVGDIGVVQLPALGGTGGEPFLLGGLPEALAKTARILPTLVLSNGTLFTPALLSQLAPLAELDFRVQISLDSAEPAENDEMRGPRNFARVLDAIPRLRRLGIPVRIATTSEGMEPEALARLCELHRSLGVPDEDHVVRPIVSRGRALDSGLGMKAALTDLPPELTLTADGSFWSPFGPTVHGGRLDTDLLLTLIYSHLHNPTDTPEHTRATVR